MFVLYPVTAALVAWALKLCKSNIFIVALKRDVFQEYILTLLVVFQKKTLPRVGRYTFHRRVEVTHITKFIPR